VLAQREVDGAPGEVPGLKPPLERLDLAGTVVTADALQTHAEAADFLVTVKQGHYLFTIKANQPTLPGRCKRLAWHNVPVLDRTRDQAHGRVAIRTLKAVSVRGLGGFPHAAQVLQVTRKVRDLGTRSWRTTVIYAVTSLAHAQASPARLADDLRGRWAIENGLHYVRDVTFGEDASQVPTGTGPHVMTCLRNLVIGTLSRAGRPGPGRSSPARGGRTALQQLLEVLVAPGRPLCRHAADAVGHQPAEPPPLKVEGGGEPRPCAAVQRLDRDRPDRPQRPADARSGEPAGRAELGDFLGGLVLHTAELAGGREPGAHAERAASVELQAHDVLLPLAEPHQVGGVGKDVLGRAVDLDGEHGWRHDPSSFLWLVLSHRLWQVRHCDDGPRRPDVTGEEP
jgi:predicted transposase YbfD/YdcC